MRFQLFAFVMLIGMMTFAQEDYLITLQGEKIVGDIELFQNRFYDEAIIKTDDGKETYKVFQVESVRMDGNDYKMVTYQNKKVFGQVLKEGPLSLLYIRPENSHQFTLQYFDKKGEYLEVPNINFKKIVSDFLSDCPDLAVRIENKELKSADLDQIIDNYNRTCGTTDASLPPPQVKISSSVNEPSKSLNELSQLIIDIQAKLDNNEKVPSYLVEALKSYSEKDINKEIKELIKRIEE